MKNRKWEKYLKSNKCNTLDCQLVTAVNANYYLTGNSIQQNSAEYNTLIDITKCKHGACISIEDGRSYLGINEDIRFKSYDLNKYLFSNCFIEVNVWHKYFGYHSIAIVDYIEKASCVRVTNFKHVASTNGWIFLEDLKPHIILNPGRSEPRYECRTYKLITNEKEK